MAKMILNETSYFGKGVISELIPEVQGRGFKKALVVTDKGLVKLGNDGLQESEKEKDLGVVINNRLSPEEHIQEKVRSMHNLLANMKVAFTYIDEEMVKKIIIYIIHTSYAWVCSSSMEPPFEETHRKMSCNKIW